MSKKIEEEMTEQFSQIWKQYNDPLEMRKKQNLKLREKIKEDKQSSYCLENYESF